MGLLVLSAADVRHHADELVNVDIVGATLEMVLEILAFKTVELALVNNDTNFLWQPAGCGPEGLGIRALYCCIDHQHTRNREYRFPLDHLLVSVAFIAPATGLILSFDTGFENL